MCSASRRDYTRWYRPNAPRVVSHTYLHTRTHTAYHKRTWQLGINNKHEWDVTGTKRFFTSCFEKFEWILYCIIFSVRPPLSRVTAERRFYMFCKTFWSISVGVFRIVDAIGHFNWVKLVHVVLKTLSLTIPQRKKSIGVVSRSKLANLRDLFVQSMNLAFSIK